MLWWLTSSSLSARDSGIDGGSVVNVALGADKLLRLEAYDSVRVS